MNDVIPRFWQLEEVTNQRFFSPEDKVCEKIFLETNKRLGNGRFQVDLPLRNKDDY